jgi:hypothetical protein
MGNETHSQQPPAPTETTDLRYLDAGKLRLFRHGATLRLTIEGEASWLKVSVVRVFPLSRPQRHLSLRDGKNKEIGILVDAGDLDAEGRQLVEEELGRRYLVPVIRRVLRVRERFGTVDWEVETDRGVCTFTMRSIRENVYQPSPGRYLLTDVESNRYDVPDLSALDPASQSWLLRYL